MQSETKDLLTKVKAAGFKDAEVTVAAKKLSEMQIDASEISLMRTTDNVGITLRGILNGRYATVSLNQLDNESTSAGIKALRQAAEAAPIDEARQFAPDQGKMTFSYGPAVPNLEQMFDRLSEINQHVKKEFPDLNLEQCMVDHTDTTAWTSNTLGLNVEQRQGHYGFTAMFSAKRGDKTTSFSSAGAMAENLSAPFIEWGTVRSAMESSIRELDHQPFNGKFVGAMVMTPDSIGELFGPWLSHLGNDRLISGTSVLKDKMGKGVASEALTIRISPNDPMFAIKDFVTGDGYKSSPSTIVENGILKSWLLSDYGSRKTGLPRATNSGANMIIEAGAKTKMQMVSQIKKGLWLGRFSGGGPAANGDFSGVAKSSFLIENGELAAPLSEVMISGNLFTMLQSIMGISSERVNNGSDLLPWIAVDGITVAGK